MSTAAAAVSVDGTACQRWRNGRPSWRRPSDGGFDAARYAVTPVAEADAKAYVTTHHYSGTYPAAVHRFGLLDTTGPQGPELVGVAVFGIPVSRAVLTGALPALQPYVESLELSRFVLDDGCPANSESWFLARCFSELLTRGIRGVVSFADPVPRTTSTGAIVAPGHIGLIYQASNAVYAGRGTARTLTLMPDGTVLNGRAAQKVRRQEPGHDYVERKLVAYGASIPAAGQDMTRWLATALDDIGARRLRHQGAHRYVFPLGRNGRDRGRVRAGLPNPGRYPKDIDHSPANDPRR